MEARETSSAVAFLTATKGPSDALFESIRTLAPSAGFSLCATVERGVAGSRGPTRGFEAIDLERAPPYLALKENET